ncbi:MAG TPA: metallophosphoesterase [Vicinamibacterales bacterium]|nr:metallophosphoesterase [Vicinamibacterales bacterium]
MASLARVLLFACVVVAATLTQPSTADVSARAAARRIVAVADVHGDLDAFIAILQRAQVLDAAGKWAGGATTLVQLGDMIDRGPKSRGVLDLVMALQKDARRTDGRVLVALGNHEVMNMYGDLRYVTPEDYATFVDKDSEKRRTAAYEDYVDLSGKTPPQSRDEWMAAHPPGFVEQRDAFGPDGKYGRWLRSLPAVVKVDDTAFVHGGVSAEISTWSIGRLNERVAAEIKAFDDARQFLVAHKMALPFSTLQEVMTGVAAGAQRKIEEVLPLVTLDKWFTISEIGPLWSRDLAKLPDADAEPIVTKALDAMGVARLVVGHTPEPGEIVQRFGDKVYLIDTGMLRGYVDHGHASALEIADGHVRAIYPDGVKVLK